MPADNPTPPAPARDATASSPRGLGHNFRGGFTLVEALIALLLIAVVLPVVIQAISTSLRLGVYADRRAQAVALAENQLAEIVLSGDWQYGDAEGVFTEDDAPELDEPGAFHWALAVEDWTDTSYQQFTMTVTWQQRQRERSVSLSTVVNNQDDQGL